MSTMLLYDKIIPLNRDNHRDLRLKSEITDASFAADTHYVPLAVTEFHQAARDYPIIFAGDESEPAPVALLGLREKQNLFLDDNRSWVTGAYVPAFVRRYPFVLARAGENDEYTVCFDEAFEGFSKDDGNLLFDSDGKDTAYLAGTISFLNRFLADMNRTRQFVAALIEHDLFVQRDLRVTDSRDRNFVLQDFRMVDEGKLAGLDDATLGQLHRDGFLGWIYAHLISLGNAARLPTRLSDKDSADPPEAEVHFDETDDKLGDDADAQEQNKGANGKDL